MVWETPYGPDAKYYTSGDYIIAWETVAEGHMPPDWLYGDGDGKYLRSLGFRSDGRWQVRRLTGPENSEALEIAPTISQAKQAVERMVRGDRY